MAKLYKAPEFSRMLGLSLTTLNRMIKEGKVTPIMIGRNRYFNDVHLQELGLISNTAGSVATTVTDKGIVTYRNVTNEDLAMQLQRIEDKLDTLLKAIQYYKINDQDTINALEDDINQQIGLYLPSNVVINVRVERDEIDKRLGKNTLLIILSFGDNNSDVKELALKFSVEHSNKAKLISSILY